MNSSSALDVQNLRKVYRDGLLGRRSIEALRGVSLSVGRGEIFGLLGPNGAGKTTLIKVLLGIVRSTGGAASLMGQPAGSRAGRRNVGYLPENHRIPRHHTGESALAFFGSLSGLSASQIRARRPEMLRAVGLADWGRTSVKKYSKGMLQRLGMAQAMMHDPDLLILDEPTDGVDPVGRSEMRTLLQQLKVAGKTIFINSHLLQEVELVCDRVAILAKGQVLREGTIADLTVRADSEVSLEVAGAEIAIRAALASAPTAELRPTGANQFELTLTVPDQGAVDRLIDQLRANSVSLISLSRGRQTLEEAFLTILEESRRAP